MPRSDLAWTRRPVLALVVGVLVVLLLVGTVLLGRSRSEDAGSTAPPTYRDGRAVVADSFERTVAGGWGRADVGGTYTSATGADLEVADGVGVVNLPRPGVEHQAALPEARAQDFIATVDVIAPATVARGSGVYVAAHLRTSGGFYYRPLLRFGSDAKVYLSLARFDGQPGDRLDLVGEKVVASGVEAGTRLTLEVAVTGVTPVNLRATVSTDSSTAVSVDAVDASASRLAAAGSFALWAYVAGSSDADKVVAFDDLVVRQQVTGPPGAEDGTGSLGGRARPDGGGDTVGDVAGGEDDEAAGRDGSAAVGTTHYDVPADALFVSPAGTADGPGTVDAPFGLIQDAVDAAPSGATVVLRAGSYHESVLLPLNKVVDLQAYPGEEVWLDGSTVVRGWRRSGRVWQVPWTTFFDSSPTYTKGAPDRAKPGWRFVNPAHPMAAHPDQVWVDGIAQTQVGRRSQVTDGTFWVDRAKRRLVLGTDPAGATVRASTLDKALTIVGAGDRVRGLGVRRYATSVWQLGAVTVNNTDVSVENVVLEDNATTGLSVFAADATLHAVTATRNGLMGLHAEQADRLDVSDVLVTHNNLERFNRAPAAGGMKLTSSHEVRVAGSVFADNRGHGLWFDSASYDVDVVGSRAERNTGAGLVVEISSQVRVVDNVLLDNGVHGLWVIDTDRVEVANNSLARNAEANLVVVTDGRRPADAEPGDRPRAAGDPTMSWVSRDVHVYNNVLADAGGAPCVVCVVDHTHRRTANQLRVVFDHNYYAQAASTAASVFASWPARKKALRYGDLAGYRAATGQDRASVSVVGGASVVDRQGRAGPAVGRVADKVARELTGPARAAVGPAAPQRPGLGAWSS